MGETKWRMNTDGVLECYDTETGLVQYIEKKKTHSRNGSIMRRGPGRGRRSTDGSETHEWVVDANGRKHWVLRGTDPDSLPHRRYPYCRSTVEAICGLVVEGFTIKEIGQLDGFPNARTIYNWLARHDDFAAELARAKKLQAEFFADSAIEVAEDADEENIAHARLLVETYKWKAEIGDRATYGKQTKVTGDPDAPVGFIISTGIHRATDNARPNGSPALEGRTGEAGESALEVRNSSGSAGNTLPVAGDSKLKDSE